MNPRNAGLASAGEPKDETGAETGEEFETDFAADRFRNRWLGVRRAETGASELAEACLGCIQRVAANKNAAVMNFK